MSSVSSPGRPDRSGSSVASRASTSMTEAPIGGCPVAANSSVAPSEYTSLATDAPWVSLTAPAPCKRACRRLRARSCGPSAGSRRRRSRSPAARRARPDIRGLQVPVHQPDPVDRLQRLRAPGGQPPYGGHRQRTAGQHQPGQRGRRDVRRSQPGQVGIGSASTTAAVKTPLTFRAAATSCANRCRKPASGQLNLDRLDRDQPSRRRTPQVHLAHRAGTEAAENHVRPDTLRIPSTQCFPGGRCFSGGRRFRPECGTISVLP